MWTEGFKIYATINECHKKQERECKLSLDKILRREPPREKSKNPSPSDFANCVYYRVKFQLNQPNLQDRESI